LEADVFSRLVKSSEGLNSEEINPLQKLGFFQFAGTRNRRAILLGCALAQAQSLQADEAAGVIWIVIALHAFHRSDVCIVEGKW